MPLFHVIDEATVILKNKRGVYRQAKVYSRGEDVYAGFGSGFVRLLGQGHSTCPDVLWDDLDGRNFVTIPRVGAPKFGPVPLRNAA